MAKSTTTTSSTSAIGNGSPSTPRGFSVSGGFDYANLFCNPDLADPANSVATLPGILQRRVEIVSKEAGLDRCRLLRWILAWSGLSAAWFIPDGVSPKINLQVAELAEAELDR
jgi:streptomycin 6-kinase